MVDLTSYSIENALPAADIAAADIAAPEITAGEINAHEITAPEPAVADRAAREPAVAEPDDNGFAALGLPASLLQALARLDIRQPTPVQLAAIPVMLEGRDLIASAPTGTGKTAAFMLPALARLMNGDGNRGRGPRVLVLTPTRELAQQVAKATQGFARGQQRLSTVCVTGGESYIVQNRLLSAPYEVLVATPGRLADQMRTGRIHLGRVEMLVLDEADRMLDMGFADEVTAIAEATPAGRQTVCFTATVSPAIRGLTNRLLRDPHWLAIERPEEDAVAIEDHILFVDDAEHRLKLLEACLRSEGLGQAIVFTATKRHAEELADHLGRQGFGVDALHGDMNQRERLRAMNRVRRGECKVLVATDVAARGIDVSTITHVINYNLPKSPEDYVHRIGRTGRAGAQGQALSFVGAEDAINLNRIEHVIGRHIQVSEFEGMVARFKPSAQKPRRKARPGFKSAGYKAGFKPGYKPAGPRHGAPAPAHRARTAAAPGTPRPVHADTDGRRAPHAHAPGAQRPAGGRPGARPGNRPDARPFAPRRAPGQR